jgi:transcription elongation GreA/GreB family factor
MGQALDGKKPGETATYTTPKGTELEVEVVSVRPLD